MRYHGLESAIALTIAAIAAESFRDFVDAELGETAASKFLPCTTTATGASLYVSFCDF